MQKKVEVPGKKGWSDVEVRGSPKKKVEVVTGEGG